MSGRAALGDERLDHGDDLVGFAGVPDAHHECFAGVFADDVQQFEVPAIGGVVELEVQRAVGFHWCRVGFGHAASAVAVSS
jgi:hypothetical protein